MMLPLILILACFLSQITARPAVSGRIYDVDGNPASLIQVQALKYRVMDGTGVLEKVATAETGEDGMYRLSGLTPGDYYVRALPTIKGALDRQYFAPVYYPGVTDLKLASPVRVKAGDEVNTLHFPLTLRGAYTVRIRIDNVHANPFNHFPRFSVIPRGLNLVEEPAPPFVAVGGNTYEAMGFLPGSYEIFASIMTEPADPVEIGSLSVEVLNEDVHAGTLQIRAGVRVRGRVAPDESLQDDLKFANLGILLLPLDRTPRMYSPRVQSIASNGEFEFRSVPRGRFELVVTGLPAGVQVSAAKYGGRNVLEEGITVEGDPPGPLEILLRRPQ